MYICFNTQQTCVFMFTKIKTKPVQYMLLHFIYIYIYMKKNIYIHILHIHIYM